MSWARICCSAPRKCIPNFKNVTWRRAHCSDAPASSRSFSTVRALAEQVKNEKNSGAIQNGKAKERLAERDFFLSVLSANTTRRDASAYLSRFNNTESWHQSQPWTTPLLHAALVKLRAPQILDNHVIDGLAHTISQLAKLGLSSVIVVDCDDDNTFETNAQIPDCWRNTAVTQADRLVAALENHGGLKACRLDYVLGAAPMNRAFASTIQVRGAVEVQYSKILHGRMIDGTVPVIPAIAYSTDSQQATRVDADDVVLALARDLSGLNSKRNSLDQGTTATAQEPTANSHACEIVLEKIILLDPLGGLPSSSRPDGGHVFVNLEQEYDEIRQELLGATSYQPLPSHAEDGIDIPSAPAQSHPGSRHAKNLDLVQQSLALLPPSASALLTTPHRAATMTTAQDPHPAGLGVGTRRPKNPLIFNLLTDKPLISSSLPAARLRSTEGQVNPATFIKRGMPLTIIPDPRQQIWRAPESSAAHLTMQDPRIDFPRLLHLIEDSFNRPLDVSHYLRRIERRIAGIIIAGEYEGGAILTWELPPGVPDDGSEASRARMVPYLDKFAVLKRSQGAGGVADTVFTAMVRSCFPSGVCWRSRKNNPVNKWYFERAAGTWKLPETEWTMFWTTEGLEDDGTRFLDYANVCRNVKPSWADNKNVLD